ncbi:hypothetical protein THII_3663 [Thioploca ingrica]|uniref:Uncharacterized protein n=1 Tax=Thioploca ingrica TaxID=40754 RepID=A0A090AQM7_9GAMM|nr:hypothetical protein THII_3663 [Thioploca ingrica]
MASKYQSYFHFLVAKFYRNYRRYQIAKLITWEPLPPLEEGCTAIIGMCSRIPYILGANLYCLSKNRWSDLKAIIIAVDAEKSSLPAGFEEEVIKQFPELKLTFIYYNHRQAQFTAQVNDPYIYSWLSWSLCLNHIWTKTALIQDYDALILGKEILAKRYQAFSESGAKMQGITWYKGNNFVVEDHLATTFEAFIDVNWIRSFPPVMGHNKFGIFKGRQVNYDTYLDIQANYTPESQRTVMPMSLEDLAHPSNLITQYMRFRNSPGKPSLCFSIPMLPFFYFLAGRTNAFTIATQALQRGDPEHVDLLGDGVQMNLTLLDIASIDFNFKLILQVLLRYEIKPFKELIDYGIALYQIIKTPVEQIWLGDFTPVQREWIAAAKRL